MTKQSIFMIFVMINGTTQIAYAQTDELNMELAVSDEDKITFFAAFVIIVIGIFLFLARDTVLRRKTSYDKKEFESKKDKTYEKYHSDWGDDFEELGKRKNTKEDKEFRDALKNNELPNYYELLEVSNDAAPDEIKTKFRELAKKVHPDKTKEDSEEKMAELNKAYEILSDKERREKYDKYLKVN